MAEENRKRLTQRVAETKKDGLFPGDIGNEERPVVEQDKYDNYEQVPVYELKDERTEWKDNPRDELNVGIPKVAKIYAAAHNAVKLATMFLGDKVADSVIEAQAREFMRLGSARLESSLKRYAESEELYKEDAPVEEESLEAKKKEVAPANPAPAIEEKPALDVKPAVAAVAAAPVAPVVAEVKQADQNAAPVAASGIANDVKPVQEVSKEQEELQKAPVATAAAKTADALEQAPAAEVPAEVPGEIAAEDDGEDFFSEETSLDDQDVEQDEELASLFAEDTKEEGIPKDVEASKKTAKKQGISKLGAQPKIASAKKLDDLAGLWKDVPDVSSAFGSN